jgi:hypothetical protein
MKYEARSVYRPTNVGENLSFTSASAQSAALRGGVYALCPTQTCYIQLGPNPTATVGAGSMRIPANTNLYITAHQSDKIAAIRETTDGILNITLQQ